MDEDQICPQNPDGPGQPHSPDWRTVKLDYDGGEAYIDIVCQFCGITGTLGTAEKLMAGLIWEAEVTVRDRQAAPVVDPSEPICPLTVGDVAELYDDYAHLFNLGYGGTTDPAPAWEGLTLEQQKEVVDIAARLLYVDGEWMHTNFQDAFNDRLGSWMDDGPSEKEE